MCLCPASQFTNASEPFQRRGPIWWLCGGIMCQIYQIYLCPVYIQENKWDWRKYISTIWWRCVVGSCVNEGLCDLLIWPAVWFTAYWKVTPIPPYQLQQISHLGEKRMVGVDKTAYCSNRCYWLNIVEVLNIVELKSMLSDIYWAQAAAKTLILFLNVIMVCVSIGHWSAAAAAITAQVVDRVIPQRIDHIFGMLHAS